MTKPQPQKRKRSPRPSPSTDDEPIQGTCTWDELLYEMTHGALGVKPQRGTPLNDGHKTQQKQRD